MREWPNYVFHELEHIRQNGVLDMEDPEDKFPIYRKRTYRINLTRINPTASLINFVFENESIIESESIIERGLKGPLPRNKQKKFYYIKP